MNYPVFYVKPAASAELWSAITDGCWYYSWVTAQRHRILCSCYRARYIPVQILLGKQKQWGFPPTVLFWDYMHYKQIRYLI